MVLLRYDHVVESNSWTVTIPERKSAVLRLAPVDADVPPVDPSTKDPLRKRSCSKYCAVGSKDLSLKKQAIMPYAIKCQLDIQKDGRAVLLIFQGLKDMLDELALVYHGDA
ncbi:GH23820 [Drosophila grimshawi]|uniref:GH23820 n=1 Tax=Drosophila grimshawi TaxID=7222 RepID=B4K0P8_DROGR|nr:GH23820 [Drosophila grimshawi]